MGGGGYPPHPHPLELSLLTDYVTQIITSPENYVMKEFYSNKDIGGMIQLTDCMTRILEIITIFLVQKVCYRFYRNNVPEQKGKEMDRE